MSIKKILHFSDLHIKNKIYTHAETNAVIATFLEKCREEKPDRIIFTGDLFDNYVEISNEAKIIAGNLLKELSKIAITIAISGNHDLMKKNRERIDSLKTIVDLINNPNIKYLDRTDFFEDENVIYAVWNHIDKMSPWVKHTTYVKSKDKTYIDLFHDPINNCMSENGHLMTDIHHVNIGDFKGDLLLAGDIHKQQDFYKDEVLFGAYASSLHSTKFSEGDGDFHGYLIWNITDKTNITCVKNIIPNKWSYHNVNISPGFDYDNIDINIENLTEISRVNIKWHDYTANINNANERNIKKYIYAKYPNVISIKTGEKKRISSNKINDVHDKQLKKINNKEIQQEVFIEYLKDKQYDDTIISEVLTLDNIINNRLNSDVFNILNYSDIKIESFNFNNFRSYGDNNVVNWQYKDGLYHIIGNNARGKTTILYVISYLLFGVTPSTGKKQKYGDNRFINNRRNLDYCNGEIIVNINDERFLITRYTKRKWNRNKTDLTSCSTNVNFIRLNSNDEQVNETEEQKKDTQKIINESIGTFDDFIRKVYTDSDSLNTLLSNDRSQFITNILYDTGLDIFDKKLDSYKDYKKEAYVTKEKIVMDLPEREQKIQEIIHQIASKQGEVNEIKSINLIDINDRINKGTILKEDEIKKLHKIDSNLTNLNIDNIKLDINKLTTEKQEKINEIDILDNRINKLAKEYDAIKLKELQENVIENKEAIISYKQSIVKFKNEIEQNTHKIHVINGEILLINKEITQYNIQIDNEIKFIDRDINLIKTEISNLEKSKTCPTCKRLYGDKEVSIIQQTILDKENLIKEKELSKIHENNTTIIEINKNIVELQVNIGLKELSKPNILDLNIIIEENIKKINSDIDLINNKINEIQENITLIEKNKLEFELSEKLELQRDNIPTLISLIDLKIQNHLRNIDDYEKNLVNIIENKKIEEKITKFDNRLKELEIERDNINNNINYIEKTVIINLNNEIESIKILIEKFKIQERKELVNKIYLDLIHRDGLPTLLLRRMLPQLNNELKDLLSDADFTLWFNDDVELYMSNNMYDTPQDALQGSGMERTLVAFVLKLTFMKISNKSRYNILLFDEITGKLDPENVEKFTDLLNKAKAFIDKIVIIDHYNTFNNDYIISCDVDENLISTLTLL